MRRQITVATFNIRHAKGADGKLSLRRVAEILSEADAHVVGLQEVDSLLPRSCFQRQAKKLARLLGTNFFFTPNIHLGPFGYGNATLSKFPFLKTSGISLPGELEQRGLQYCLLSLPDTAPLHFLNTHLGLSVEDRTAQVQAITENLPQKSRPVILTGDFNAPACSPELTPLAERMSPAGGCNPPRTFPANGPLYSIDQIYVSEYWGVKDIKTIAGPASDHLPLVCVLEPA